MTTSTKQTSDFTPTPQTCGYCMYCKPALPGTGYRWHCVLQAQKTSTKSTCSSWDYYEVKGDK